MLNLNLERGNDLSNTKTGRKLFAYIKDKYNECFYKAKNAHTDQERLKALETMAFLDNIIAVIQGENDE